MALATTKTLNGETIRDLHAIIKTLEKTMDDLRKMTPGTPTANDAKWDAISAIEVGLVTARCTQREYLKTGE